MCRNLPMAVGSTSMLSTSNYAARKHGVRAAMPGFIALKLCPKLVIVPPNFDKYKAVSKCVGEVFALYDVNHVMMSLDEAYLDLTEFLAANGATYEVPDGDSIVEVIVREMRDKIHEKTQLTASAGNYLSLCSTTLILQFSSIIITLRLPVDLFDPILCVLEPCFVHLARAIRQLTATFISVIYVRLLLQVIVWYIDMVN